MNISLLKDCVEILDSKRIPLSKEERQKLEKIYPYYGAQEIIDYVDEYLFDGDYILVAEDGDNLKSRKKNIATWVEGKFWVNNHAHILGKKDGFHLKYIYYLLNAIDIEGYITGSAQPKLNQKNLANIKLSIPSYDQQKKIVQPLDILDKKISINNSIISKLEEMAKTIYEYWFLQFDFPNAEGKPYASSGGAMKYSEELGREIPTDWEVLNLWERFEFEKGIEIGAKQYLNESGKDRVLFWRVGDMNGTCSTYADEKLFGELLLQPRDICVSFDGSVGKVDFGLVGGYSSGIRNIYDKAKKIDSSVIYQIFKSDHIQQLIHKYATGSNILHASGSITNMRIPYNEKVFEEYQKIIKPMFDKMVQAKQENKKLAQLRDWLLPMLMNGQVRVE